MKVIFSHGKESGPWGTKIKRLADCAQSRGLGVDSIDYRETLDPDKRVEKLVKALRDEKDVLLVGSSMGGYVSLVAAEQQDIAGIFLLAPALYISGYQRQDYTAAAPIEIVHGWSDTVIPVENSIKFAKSTESSLHLIAGDHRLNSSLEVVEELFDRFLLRYT